MKKKNVMLMILMMASTIIFAQRHHGGDGQARMDKVNEYMKTELSLTDDQYAKVKSINQSFGERYKNLRSDSTASKESSRAERKKIQDEHAAALKSVLTDKQYAQWTALKANHGGKGKHDATRIDNMKKELSLSDDQYSKVKAIDQNFGERFKAMRKDSTMSKDAARAQFKKIRDERNVAIKGVLTSDQYNKWLSMKDKHQHHGDWKRKKGASVNPDDKKG